MAGSSSSCKRIGSSDIQPQISAHSISNTPISLRNISSAYDYNNHTKHYAEFVALENLPHNFCSKLTVEEFCQSLNPAANSIQTTTLTRALKKLYRNRKKDLIKLFADVNNNVSLSVDIWSDFWHLYSYISVTCYWVDDSWSIQKRLLAFRIFHEAHTAENISQMIFSVLEEYNLTSKIFSISYHNADSNIAGIEDVKLTCESSIGGVLFPNRYICHVLNLCAIDGLRHLEPQLRPVKQAIDYLWAHPQVMRQWAKFCKANGKKPKLFSRDVPTRWDSTFLLLHETISYKDLLCTFFMHNVDEMHLSPNQWVVCNKVCKIFKPIYDTVLRLWGAYDSKVHLILFDCASIAAALKWYSNDEDLKDCVEAMRSTWKKYLFKFPVINLVALVFYPWVRLEGLQELLRIYYDYLLPVKDEHSPDPALIANDVRQYLSNFYNEYKSKYGEQATQSKIRYTGLHQYDLFLMKMEKKKMEYRSRELENYLSAHFISDEINDPTRFDILEWWSEREQTFPILSRMVKEVLVCPTSTVAPEQVTY